jgi:thiol-disulfide isomerase/thioredoxin
MLKKIVTVFFFGILVFSVQAQQWHLDQIKVYDEYDRLATELVEPAETVHVINFWATWCKPCVAELPYLEALLDEDRLSNLKLTLVSLDFKNQIERKLLKFLNEHSIKANVVVLTDGKTNEYINKVDKTWEGSIPATLFVKGDKRVFYEGSFHNTQEIIDIINSIN